ncbi:MAG: hypothetical protein FWF44_09620, partial [Defluviitaleaceae bacterium]|nr:hypothetical protein [Defluviitaleaceae bacterium]
MTLTDFLKLRKPDFTIPADIRDINFNMDILDAKAQELDNAIKGTGSSDGIMNMIRQITGEADWSDPPAVALNGKVTGKWTIY